MIQGFSISQWVYNVRTRPLELIVGLLVFSVIAAGGAVQHVASASLVFLLIASLFYVRTWPEAWQQLTSAERLVLFGLVLYVISAFLSYYNVSDEHEYMKHLGKYARFLFIVPIYLLITRADLRLFNYLLAGAVASAPVYLAFALVSIAERPGFNAHGHYHHIIFGDMAMVNAMFMTTVLLLMKANKILKVTLAVSIICVLYASFLSQSRGAWLALPFFLLLLMYVVVIYKKIKIWNVLIVPAVIAVIVVFSPVADIVSSRLQIAGDQIAGYQNEGKYRTSVGVRLAMWEAAVIVWKESPIVGSGPGDFDLDMQSDPVKKVYDNMPPNSSAHSNYFQALATTGTIGFIALCLALIILPLRLFYKSNKKSINIPAISGMVVITGFSVFGLTESWILRSPMISVFLVYLVTLATAATAEANYKTAQA